MHKWVKAPPPASTKSPTAHTRLVMAAPTPPQPVCPNCHLRPTRPNIPLCTVCYAALKPDSSYMYKPAKFDPRATNIYEKYGIPRPPSDAPMPLVPESVRLAPAATGAIRRTRPPVAKPAPYPERAARDRRIVPSDAPAAASSSSSSSAAAAGPVWAIGSQSEDMKTLRWTRMDDPTSGEPDLVPMLTEKALKSRAAGREVQLASGRMALMADHTLKGRAATRAFRHLLPGTAAPVWFRNRVPLPLLQAVELESAFARGQFTGTLRGEQFTITEPTGKVGTLGSDILFRLVATFTG